MANVRTCCSALQPRFPNPVPVLRHVSTRRSIQPPRSTRDDAAAPPASKSSSQPATPATASEGISAAATTHTTFANAPPPTPSGDILLTFLQQRARNPSTVNVYGKPYTKTELAALEAAVSYVSTEARGSAAAAGGPATLRRYLLEGLLLEAALAKHTPLPVVEGAMALLELLPRNTEPTDEGEAALATGRAFVDDPGLLSRYRWQLVVGADVGGVQYIPAVEELEVSADGLSFFLGTDLDFVFTGFSGPSRWLAPGHLTYTVRQVRVELRWPKAWRRAAAYLAWRRRLGDGAATATSAGDQPDWADSLPTAPTCRENPSAPATTIPLPFPTNEILAFSCDGRVAATRSRLTGGLVLLLEVGTRELLRGAGAP